MDSLLIIILAFFVGFMINGTLKNMCGSILVEGNKVMKPEVFGDPVKNWPSQYRINNEERCKNKLANTPLDPTKPFDQQRVVPLTEAKLKTNSGDWRNCWNAGMVPPDPGKGPAWPLYYEPVGTPIELGQWSSDAANTRYLASIVNCSDSDSDNLNGVRGWHTSKCSQNPTQSACIDIATNEWWKQMSHTPWDNDGITQAEWAQSDLNIKRGKCIEDKQKIYNDLGCESMLEGGEDKRTMCESAHSDIVHANDTMGNNTPCDYSSADAIAKAIADGSVKPKYLDSIVNCSESGGDNLNGVPGWYTSQCSQNPTQSVCIDIATNESWKQMADGLAKPKYLDSITRCQKSGGDNLTGANGWVMSGCYQDPTKPVCTNLAENESGACSEYMNFSTQQEIDVHGNPVNK